MTDEVIEKVASMSETALAKALEYVEAAEGFVVEQAPLLVQEILAWGFAEHLIYALLWGVFGLTLLISVVKLCRFLYKVEPDGEVAWVVGLFGSGVSVLLGFVSFCYALEVVKISVAPRLYLLEAFKGLL